MKLIVLDRDGVINHDSDAYIKSPEEWIPIPGSLEAIARLNKAGFTIVVATNQSGIARGLFDKATLDRIHEKMQRMLHEAGGKIEAIYFCPDSNNANPNRKPNPGMLKDISRYLKVDLKGVPMVGDALRDIQAAQAVGAEPLLVRTGKGQRTIAKGEGIEQVKIFDDLVAIADYLLTDVSRETSHGVHKQ